MITCSKVYVVKTQKVLGMDLWRQGDYSTVFLSFNDYKSVEKLSQATSEPMWIPVNYET